MQKNNQQYRIPPEMLMRLQAQMNIENMDNLKKKKAITMRDRVRNLMSGAADVYGSSAKVAGVLGGLYNLLESNKNYNTSNLRSY